MIAYLLSHPMQIVLVLMCVVVVASLYVAHKRTDIAFDLLDLLMENGRVSKIACTFLATFIITSWVIVKLTLDEKLTEGFLTVYGGFWITPLVAKLVFGKSAPDAPAVVP